MNKSKKKKLVDSRRNLQKKQKKCDKILRRYSGRFWRNNDELIHYDELIVDLCCLNVKYLQYLLLRLSEEKRSLKDSWNKNLIRDIEFIILEKTVLT